MVLPRPSCEYATTPIMANPACAIDEYASMRLTLFWVRAIRLPTVMVNVASTDRMRLQSAFTAGKTALKSRISMANPAALEAVERKPATAVGDPSYTSGAQKWKGNSETLNANPASTRKEMPTATALNSVKY